MRKNSLIRSLPWVFALSATLGGGLPARADTNCTVDGSGNVSCSGPGTIGGGPGSLPFSGQIEIGPADARVDIDAGSAVTHSQGPTLYLNPSAANARLENRGTLHSADWYPVLIRGVNATVSNHAGASIRTDGVRHAILAQTNALGLTIQNAGTIATNGQQQNGITVNGSLTLLENSGEIFGGPGGSGVRLFRTNPNQPFVGGRIDNGMSQLSPGVNAGLIRGDIGLGMMNPRGSVDNYFLLNNHTGGQIVGTVGAGLSIASDTTNEANHARYVRITNEGIIRGVTSAIDLGTTATRPTLDIELILKTGSELDGNVINFGTNALILEGSGSEDSSFTGLRTGATITKREAGDWTLTGAITPVAGQQAPTLTVEEGGLTLAGTNNRAFTSVTISGGTLTHAGGAGNTGTLSATIDVNGGTLQADGDASSSTVDLTAGLLQGGGTLGTTTIGGGIAAPGGDGAVGTLTIAGLFTQNDGGIYSADIFADGSADQFNVIGNTANLNDGVLRLLSQAGGNYGDLSTRTWDVLFAADILGDFGSIVSPFAGWDAVRITDGVGAGIYRVGFQQAVVTCVTVGPDNTPYTNGGSLDCAEGPAITGLADVTINNEGTAQGTTAGVLLGANNVLTNTGTITGAAGPGVLAAGDGAQITNSGTITGSDAGVAVTGSGNAIVNNGAVTGTTGIVTTSDDAQITNTGTITGTDGTAISMVGGTLTLQDGSDLDGQVVAGGADLFLEGTAANTEDSPLTGVGTLTKQGEGTWTLDSAEASDAATVRVSAGTLDLQGQFTVADLLEVTGGTLDLNTTLNDGGAPVTATTLTGGTLNLGDGRTLDTTDLTLNGAAAALNVAGNATLRTGTTTVVAGTLGVATNGALGAATLLDLQGGAVNYAGTDAETIAKTQVSGGALNVQGGGTFKTGELTQTGGAVQVAANGTLDSTTTTVQGGTFDVTSDGHFDGTDWTISGGAASVAGRAMVQNMDLSAGTLGVLSLGPAANGWVTSDQWTISGTGAATVAGTADVENTDLSGGTLDVADSGHYNGTSLKISGSGAASVAGTADVATTDLSGGTLDVLAGGDLTGDALNISGTGAASVAGTADVATTDLSGGTLDVLAGGDLTGDALNISAGAASVAGTADVATTDLSGGTLDVLAGGDLTGDALNISGTGAASVAGTADVATTDLSAGTLTVADGGTYGTTTLTQTDGAVMVQQDGTLSSTTTNLDGGKMTVVGTLEGTNATVSGGTLDLQTGGTSTVGTITIAGGTFQADGNASASTVVLTTGLLQGTGTLGDTTVNGGSIGPAGDGIGTLNIAGDYTQTGGTFAVNLAKVGDDLTSDLLAVTGSATLGGTLALSGVGSFSVGDVWTILTADTVSGTFAPVTFPNGGFVWDVSYLSNAVEVLIAGATCTTLGQGVPLAVGAGQRYLCDDGSGVTTTGGSVITNGGLIRGTRDTVEFAAGLLLAGTGNVVTNNAAGVITGSDAGIAVTGDNNTIDNHGAIGAAEREPSAAVGVALIGNQNTLTNNDGGGTITGTETGIASTGADNGITNNGTVTSAGIGVSSSGADNTITNAGTITGGTGAGILADGTGAVIDNQAGASVTGTTGISTTRDDAAITNRGTITGTDGVAVSMNGGTLTLLDSSRLGGRVNAGGANLFLDGSNTESVPLTGIGTLTKQGTGTWTLDSEFLASDADTVRVTAGTLDLQGQFTVADLLEVTGGTLDLNTTLNDGGAPVTATTLTGGTLNLGDGHTLDTTDLTLNGAAAALNVAGNATLLTGTTTVVAGTLGVATNGAFGASTSLDIQGGSVQYAGTDAGTIAETLVSGTGVLDVLAGGTFTTDTLTQTGGSVTVQDGGSLTGTTTSVEDGVFGVETGGTFNATDFTVGGTGQASIAGTTGQIGTTTVNGENAWLTVTGTLDSTTTNVEGGALEVGTDGTLTTATLTQTGGSVTVQDGGSLTGTTTSVEGGVFRVNTGGAFNAMAFNVDGTGQATINGTANAGVTSLGSDTAVLVVADTGTLSTERTIVQSGSLQVEDGGQFGATEYMTVAGNGQATIAGTANSEMAFVQGDSAALTVGGTGSLTTAATVVDRGDFAVENGGQFGATTFVVRQTGQATITGTANVVGTTTVQDAAAALMVSGTLTSATTDVTSDAQLAVEAGGTLAGTNATVSGGTLDLQTGGTSTVGTITVNGGTFRADGDASASTVVLTAGLLQGGGTLGTTTIDGGIAAPGGDGAVGTLTIAGLFTQNDGGIYSADIFADGSADQFDVTGNAANLNDGVLRLLSQAGEDYGDLSTRTWDVLFAADILGDFGSIVSPFAGWDAVRITDGVGAGIYRVGFQQAVVTCVTVGPGNTPSPYTNGGSLNCAEGPAITGLAAAAPGDIVITNEGTAQGTTAGVLLGANNILTNTATGTITGTAGPGVEAAGDGARIDNSGTIEATGAGGAGLLVSGNDNQITNSGTIQGGVGGVGVNLLGTGNALTNTGLIQGMGGGPSVLMSVGDTLTLGTGSNLVGNLEAGGGDVVLTGDGSEDVALIGVGVLAKPDRGAWTLTGNSDADTLELEQGELNLGGQFTTDLASLTGGALNVLGGANVYAERTTVAGDSALDVAVDGALRGSELTIDGGDVTVAGLVELTGNTTRLLDGTLTVEGAGEYVTGTLSIEGGTLAINDDADLWVTTDPEDGPGGPFSMTGGALEMSGSGYLFAGAASISGEGTRVVLQEEATIDAESLLLGGGTLTLEDEAWLFILWPEEIERSLAQATANPGELRVTGGQLLAAHDSYIEAPQLTLTGSGRVTLGEPGAEMAPGLWAENVLVEADGALAAHGGAWVEITEALTITGGAVDFFTDVEAGTLDMQGGALTVGGEGGWVWLDGARRPAGLATADAGDAAPLVGAISGGTVRVDQHAMLWANGSVNISGGDVRVAGVVFVYPGMPGNEMRGMAAQPAVLDGPTTLTQSGGSITVDGEAAFFAADVTRLTGGTLTVQNSGTLGVATLLDLQGGTLDFAGVTSSPQGPASPETRVSGSATFNVLADGDFQTSTLAQTGGTVTVSGDFTADTSTTVSGAGALNLLTDGTFDTEQLVLQSNGAVNIAGDFTTNAIQMTGGSLNLQSGGTLGPRQAPVRAAAMMVAAAPVAPMNGGGLVIDVGPGSNFNVAGTLNAAGLNQTGGTVTIAQGGIANVTDTTLGGGAMGIAGQLDGTTLNQTGGTLTIAQGGIANVTGTTTLTGGATNVLGTLNSNVIDVGGAGVLAESASGRIVANTVNLNAGGTYRNDSNNNQIAAINVNNGAFFAANGDLSGTDVTIFAGGQMEGSGKVKELINQGILRPGNSIGTLTVNGNFTNGASGVYEAEIEPGGTSDLLLVTGTATLGGTLRVLAAPGTYPAQYDFTVVQADGGIIGDFANVTLNTDALSLQRVILPRLYLVRIFGAQPPTPTRTPTPQITPLPEIAATPNQYQVANALWNAADISADFRTQLLDLLLTLSGQPEQQRLALDSLSGELYGTTQNALLRSGERFTSVLAAQAGGQTGPYRAALAFGASGPAAGAAGGAASGDSAGRGLNFWLVPYGHWGEINGDGNASGADYSLGGLAAGVDAAVAERTRVGAALGYSQTSVNADRSFLGSSDADGLHLGLYGMTGLGAVNLSGTLAYSWYDLDASRNTVIGNNVRRTGASFDATELRAEVEANVDLELGRALAQPFLALTYSDLDQDGFTERGADSLDLNVSGASYESFTSTLGARFATEFKQDNGWTLKPEARLGWRHEYMDERGEVATRFTGATGAPAMLIRGTTSDRDAAEVRLALNATSANGRSSLYVAYDGLIGSEQTENAVSAGLSLTW